MSKIEPYYQSSMTTLYMGDCLEVMPQLPDKSVDAIVTDLPYGNIACKWDQIIPFEPLWEQYRRLIKSNGAIVLFGSQPFTTDLINSNRSWFKYCWVWEKTMPTDFLNARNKPLKGFEDIVVFSPGTTANGSKNRMVYNPQFEKGQPYFKKQKSDRRQGAWAAGNRTPHLGETSNDGFRFPSGILRFSNSNHNSYHPTQKPLELLKYISLTYTNPGDLILDNTCGSGSLLVAAQLTGRRSIGIEKEQEYCDVTVKRLQEITADRDVAINQGKAEMVQSTLFTLGAIE